MVDISNKALALVLVVAVVVSIGGTLISLNKLDAFTVTGLPIQDAIANLEIEGSIAIEFVVDNVNFGAGYAIDDGSGTSICDVATDGTYNTTGFCFGFNQSAAPLLLRNIGNVVAQIDLVFSQDAETFIGSPDAGLEFFVENAEAGSCTAGLSPTTFTTIPLTDQTVCEAFQFASANDEINIHLQALIPANAAVGLRSNTITATAS